MAQTANFKSLGQQKDQYVGRLAAMTHSGPPFND